MSAPHTIGRAVSDVLALMTVAAVVVGLVHFVFGKGEASTTWAWLKGDAPTAWGWLQQCFEQVSSQVCSKSTTWAAWHNDAI